MRIRFIGLAFAGAVSLTAAGALAQAEAERRLDAAIERLRAAIGPDARITMTGRQIDPVSGRARLLGVVVSDGTDRLNVAEVTVIDLAEDRLGRAEFRQISGEFGKDEQMQVARLTLAGLPLPAAGARFAPATLSLGQIEAEGVSASSAANGRLALARFGIEGYAPGTLRAGRLEGLTFQGSGGNQASFSLARLTLAGLTVPTPDKAPDPRSFAAEQVALEGLALRDPANQVDLALDRVTLKDWVAGRLTQFALAGLRVAAPMEPLGAGEFRLGRVEASGMDAVAILNAISDGLQMPDPSPGVPQRLEAESMTLTIAGRHLAAIGRIELEGTLDATGLATGGFAIEGVSVAPPAGSAAFLEGLGYAEILGGIGLDASARREDGMLDVESLAIGWEEAGTLALAVQVAGLPATTPGTKLDTDRYTEQLMAARLGGLTLRWEEAGLLGRALAQQARGQRVTEAQLREQWAQMALAMPLPGQPPAAAPAPGPRGRAAPAPAPAAGKDSADVFAPMRAAIASFIRNPTAIEVVLAPPAPLAFGAMQGLAAVPPAEAVRQLGLSVRIP
jgi:hypothetical protein